MKKYLSNKEMADAFGGYDFITSDMRNVCKAQRELTLKQIKNGKQLTDKVAAKKENDEAYRIR